MFWTRALHASPFLEFYLGPRFPGALVMGAQPLSTRGRTCRPIELMSGKNQCRQATCTCLTQAGASGA